MRKQICALALLLTTALPLQAADSHHVELILFRQAAMQPLYHSELAPDEWASEAQRPQPQQLRSSLLESTTAKLTPANGYQILLHSIWAQPVSKDAQHIALSSGDDSFGHYPVEGILALQSGRKNEVALDFWINSFKSDGSLAASERLQQNTRVASNELTYVDYGDLGVLIRIQPQ